LRNRGGRIGGERIAGERIDAKKQAVPPQGIKSNVNLFINNNNKILLVVLKEDRSRESGPGEQFRCIGTFVKGNCT